MRKAALLVSFVVAGALGVASWFAWQWWREQQRVPIIRAAVPAIPDLATWPREFPSRVRAATAAAHRLDQPVRALSEIACLYHANGFYREAQQAERGLRALEPKNALWAYYLADACQNLGDMEGTRASLTETVDLAPSYAPARLKLADLLFKQGRPDEAFGHYEWRLTLVPKDPYARLGLARIALLRGDRERELQLLEAIVRDHPEFPPGHSLLSELYEARGDHARALEQRGLGSAAGRFREAEDPWLNSVWGWTFDPYRLEVLGAIRMQTQQLEASLPFYEKAVRLAPEDGSAYDALGDVYMQLNRLDDARTTLERGLAVAPRTQTLYSTLAQVLRKQGRGSDAITILQSGLRLMPMLSELHNDLGVALDEAGRREEAIAAYREAVRLNPNFAEAQYNLGLSLLATGKEGLARASLERALTLQPSNAGTLIVLAQHEIDAGRLDRARAYLSTLIEYRPDMPEARSLFALWHLRQGNVAARAGRADEAEREYRAGLAFDPQSGELYANLGVLYADAGRFADALPLFRQFAVLEPQNAMAQLYLGQTLLGAGQTAEARPALEHARELARQASDGELATRCEGLLARLPP